MSEILFLAHRTPWPPDRGDRIRSHHILKALTQLAPVHLACFGEGEPPPSLGLASSYAAPRNRARLRRLALDTLAGAPLSVGLFDHAGLKRHVAQLLAERPISCIYAFSGQMAQFVPKERGGARFVMDFVDVDSAKFARYGETTPGPKGWLYAREARRLAAFERQVAARADLALFVSEAEAALFCRQTGARNARVLENGVDLAAFDPARVMPIDKRGALIVFTGQMDYPPNAEAAAAFATRTLPLIRETRPEARFAIVGRNPGKPTLALARLPGVTVTGEVADVRPWLAAASVVVAPLKLARGIQNKVLEAMAMARPVIASPAAFEGIEAEPGRDLLIADGPEAEGAAVLALLDDPAEAARIGKGARARTVERYSWSARLAGLAEIVGIAPGEVRRAA